MSLADRIDSARRAHSTVESATGPVPTRSSARHRRLDPFSDVKGRVHQALINDLGPRLYDPHLEESSSRHAGAGHPCRG